MEEGERDALLSWLGTSGHALELRMARALRRLGMEVVDPFFYEDVVTGQRREGDVLVWVGPRGAARSRLLIIFECKHTEKGEQQWIGVRSATREVRAPESGWQWIGWSGGDRFDEEHDLRLTEFVKQRGLVASDPPCDRILTAHTKESHNPAWNACRQALAAAHGVAEAYLVETDRYGDAMPMGGALAVVVTTAKLRLCQLDRSGELQLSATDRLDVLCESPRGQRRLVTVMNEDRAVAWAKGLLGLEGE